MNTLSRQARGGLSGLLLTVIIWAISLLALGKTPAGGRYLVRGQYVDANGKPVPEPEPTPAIDPEQAMTEQLADLSVPDTVALVRSGKVSAADVRAFEQAREKPRTTLLEALEGLDMLNGEGS